jgi:16S rRNA processing protein RimM
VSTTPDGLYAVGTVVKAHGVAGEVIVKPMTDFPARFRKLRTLWVGDDSASVAETGVERAVLSGRGIRLKLRGIDDRNAAERLRGKILVVDKAHRARLPRGRYFVHDVLGLAVHEEGGTELGTVAEIMRAPAGDIYVVRGDRGEILIPAVREFVRSVNLGARTMTVRLIEGMVE